MNKTKTTPRSFDSSDNKAELSGFDEIDSDEDPEYRPSDEDDGVYKMSRMFELRYQRQLEPDQTAGTSRSMDYVSDVYSEPSTPKIYFILLCSFHGLFYVKRLFLAVKIT